MIENKYLEQKNETIGENSFMKNLLKKRLNQKGLTLIELLAVIVILAIIAAIAIPAIGGLINNSEIKAVKSDAIAVINAANLEKSSTGKDFATASTVAAEYLENSGKFTSSNYTVQYNSTTKKMEITTSSAISAGGKSITFTSASVDEITSKDADSDLAKGTGASGNAVNVAD